jgi:large subunit ribosomal protein L9
MATAVCVIDMLNPYDHEDADELIRNVEDVIEPIGTLVERAEREGAERAQESAALLSKTVLTIHHRAGEDGKLFGSVTAKAIADGIRDARDLKIDPRKIKLEQPIHEIGTYMVEVELPGGVTASVKTIVAAEEK